MAALPPHRAQVPAAPPSATVKDAGADVMLESGDFNRLKLDGPQDVAHVKLTWVHGLAAELDDDAG